MPTMPLQVDRHQEMPEARNESITVENVVRGIGDELAGEVLFGVVETSVQAQCAIYRDAAEAVANRLSERPLTAANEARIDGATNTSPTAALPTAENLDGFDGGAALPGGDLSAGADIFSADVSAALGGGGGADIAAAADCCSGADCGGCVCVIS